LLRQFCAHAGHHFWGDELSIRELLAEDAAVTSSQLTDLYLLGLAVKNRAKLATLDQAVPASIIPGGLQALEVVRAQMN